MLRLLALIVCCLLVPMALHAPAAAADDAPDEGSSETATSVGHILRGKALRDAVPYMDKGDSVTRYALSVRREARGAMVGGAMILLGSLGASFLATLGPSELAHNAALFAAIGVPSGLGVMVAGVPAMIQSPLFLGWYAANGPAPSQFARLQLLRRWRLQLLRTRRGTSLISAGVFGGLGVVTGISWAAHDRDGLNGTVNTEEYNPNDAVITASFLITGGLSALAALITHTDLTREKAGKHRVFVSGYLAPAPARPVRGGAVSLGLRGGLNLRF